MKKPVIIVCGGQYGSEAKGAIAAYICKEEGVDIAVRTGATNAGHTVLYQDPAGVIHTVKLQQLPVGFVNPDTRLVLGAGSLIDPAILQREVDLLTALTGSDIRSRLVIDPRAGIHVPQHAQRSKESGRHHIMGATGKGCSEALMDRIRGRGNSMPQFGDTDWADGYDIDDTEAILNDAIDAGASVLLEGTQGQLLDLYLGPYPYVTHKQTGPAQWMLEAGLSPALETRIVMVVRTFPIRVAGNSGPLPSEVSWPALARTINEKRFRYDLPEVVKESSIRAFEDAVRASAPTFKLPPGSDGLDQHEWTDESRFTYRAALSELNAAALASLPDGILADLSKLFELTTVTKKLRRVAALDYDHLSLAARQVRPHQLALTFLNYAYPELWYETPPDSIPGYMWAYLRSVSLAASTTISHVSFGPGPNHIVPLL